jgi:putative spermidine/putrescine transport system permease protein
MKGLKAVLVLLMLPLFLAALWSVSLRWPMPRLLPSVWTLRWWKLVFSPESSAFRSLLTSGLIGLLASAFSILLGLPASRALAQETPWRRKALRLFFLAPLAVPAVGYVLGSYRIFLLCGLADSLAGVVCAHMMQCLPYAVWLLSDVWTGGVFRREEQARVLGASPFQAFWMVGLPQAAPMLASAFGFCFVVSMSQYLLTLLVGGGRFVTASVLLVPLARDGERGVAAALSLLFIALCMAVGKAVSCAEKSMTSF